jgi:hypothetical protein
LNEASGCPRLASALPHTDILRAMLTKSTLVAAACLIAAYGANTASAACAQKCFDLLVKSASGQDHRPARLNHRREQKDDPGAVERVRCAVEGLESNPCAGKTYTRPNWDGAAPEFTPSR